MNMTFLYIFIICGIYVLSQLFSRITRYKVPELLVFMFALVLLGGQLNLLPEDLFDLSGFGPMINNFGMGLVLCGFGTSMSLSSIKSEARTCVITLFAVIGILLLGGTIGMLIFDPREAIYGAVEVAGGGPAGLIFLTHAQEIGDNALVALILCLMNLQILVGYPSASYCMKRSMKYRIANDLVPQLPISEASSSQQDKTSGGLIPIPKSIQSLYYVLAILGLLCFVGTWLAQTTGLSQYVWWILLGFAAAELGIVEHNALVKAEAAPFLMSIMFMVVCSGFLTIKLTELGSVLIKVVIMLLFGVFGCGIAAVASAKIFKLDFWETMATGLGCMVGYPPSQKITSDTMNALRQEISISDDIEKRLYAYYEPKIIISGIFSISMLTGIIAGVVVSFL